MDYSSKIYVAGHNGLVGSAIVKCLRKRGYTNIIGRTRDELDLLDQQAVSVFFEKEKPEYVFLAAAKVGGIMANDTYRADFIYENLQVQNNIIHNCYKSKVKKLLFLGSSCIYPKLSSQPIREDSLLTSELEYTNEPYAIAKIAGIKMCESYNIQYGTNFLSVMPTNLFGPGDNYDLNKSHVIPGLIRKMHLAKLLDEGNFEAIRSDFEHRRIAVNGNYQSKEEIDALSEAQVVSILTAYGISSHIHHPSSNVSHPSSHASRLTSDKQSTHNPITNHQSLLKLWGTGTANREFLYSEDMADASVYVMENINFLDLVSSSHASRLTSNEPTTQHETRNTHINIGSGSDVTIAELASLVQKVVGYDGKLEWDNTHPDGTPRKLMDNSKLSKLGWTYTTTLEEGLKLAYKDYLSK